MKCRKMGRGGGVGGGGRKTSKSQIGKQILFSNFSLYFVLVYNRDGYFVKRLIQQNQEIPGRALISQTHSQVIETNPRIKITKTYLVRN